MVELVVEGNILAAGRAFFHIGSQREHLKFLVPYSIAAVNSTVFDNGAIREGHVKALVRLVGPSVAQTEQFANHMPVRTEACVAAAKAADRGRKAQGIRVAGIDSDFIPTDAHLNGVHIWIGAQVCITGLGEAGRIAAKKCGAVVKLHLLSIVI